MSMSGPGVSLWECKWNVVASQPRETLKRKIYTGSAYCSLLRVNHARCAFASVPAAYMEIKTPEPRERYCFSPSVYTSPFLIPTKDGTITDVTLTGGNYPSLYQSSVLWDLQPPSSQQLLKCGWATQAAQLVLLMGVKDTQRRANVNVIATLPRPLAVLQQQIKMKDTDYVSRFDAKQ